MPYDCCVEQLKRVIKLNHDLLKEIVVFVLHNFIKISYTILKLALPSPEIGVTSILGRSGVKQKE